MKPLRPEDPETKSADVLAENVEALKAMFPEAFTEGRVDFAVLKQLLGGALEDREEKYGLSWHGKRQARQLALTPSTGTLRPRPEESVDWDTTQNLMIEGDNLEVLKLLQKSYAGKVKLIYIDPPYNTGKDFVYPDNFRDNIQNYLSMTGQIDEAGTRRSSNSEASGRFHTTWMSMMFPRLKAARNLLSDDGLLFVTIDDNEVGHLRLLMAEIFGEENFICNVVWQKAYTANQTAQFISDTHDHILVVAKNLGAVRLGRFQRTEDQKAKFKNPDADPRGPWKAENLSAGKFYAAGQYEIVGPTGERFKPPAGRYWRCNEATYNEWLADGRITFGQGGDGRPMLKKYLAEVEEGLTPQSWWTHEEFGSNKEASIELKALFDGEAVFQTPKPVKLIRRICELATPETGVVLDFFAGSGTTGHAVMTANATAGGRLRYILVQMPEPIEESSYATIADVCKERLRRAGRKVRSENPLFSGDLGFRVFKLDSTNIRPWDPDRENLERTLDEAVEHVKADRSEADVLFELLLKLGLDLTVPIEKRGIAGKEVHSIGAGALIACLAKEIGAADVEPLALGIVEWHASERPAGESTIVFRDSAFADDVAKTNLTAILEQHGLGNVRSL